MLRSLFWTLFAFGWTAGALLGGCAATDDVPGEQALGYEGPVTASGTGTLAAAAVALDETADLVVEAEALRAPLTAAPELADLAPGDVVYSAEAGFLRRVLSVATEGDEVVVATEPAPLSALFEEAEFQLQVGSPTAAKSKADGPSGGDTTVDVNFDGETLYDSGVEGDHRLSIKATRGSIVGSPAFLADFVFSHTQVHLAQIQSSGFLVLDLALEIEASTSFTFEKEKEIPLLERSTIVFVGSVPVHLTPYVKLVLKGEGKAEGKGKATTGLRATLPVNHALKYHDVEGDDWVYTAVNNYNLQPQAFEGGELEASLTGKLSIDVEVGLKVYEQASLAVALGPYAQLEIKVLPDCTWTLKAGLAGQLTAKIESIGPWDEQEKSWQLFESEKKLAGGACFATQPGPDVVSGLPDAGGAPDSGGPEPEDVVADDIPEDTSDEPDVTIPPGSVYDGDLIATNDAELLVLTDKVLVTGQVAITGSARDLSPLANLRRVGGSFEIQNSQVSSLLPLAELETVEGIFRIRDNPLLASSEGLSSLESTPAGFFVDLSAAGGRIEGVDALATVGAWFQLAGGEAVGFEALRRVDGDVSLQVVALDGLDALEEITGGLALGSPLEVAEGLDALRRIGGALTINSAVVPPFPSLLSVARDIVVGSDTLTVLSGFPSLGLVQEGDSCSDWVANGVVIEDCAALERIEGFPLLQRIGCLGSLHIRMNPALKSIDAFGGLLDLEGELRIELNPELETIRGFGALTDIRHDFAIRDNDKLQSIGPFSALTRAGCELAIWGNPLLTNAGSFPLLTAFWPCGWGGEDLVAGTANCFLQFSDNPALTSLPSFTSLEACGTVLVTGCDTLSHVEGFSSLAHVSSFEASDNAQLANLAGLDELAEAEWITVTGNPTLTSLSGLDSLATVSNLNLVDNDSLVSFSGLGGLVSVGNFRLEGNDTIASLAGLFAGVAVGYVSVQNNDSLDQCATEDWFASLTTGGGSPSSGIVANNGGQEACPERKGEGGARPGGRP